MHYYVKYNVWLWYTLFIFTEFVILGEILLQSFMQIEDNCANSDAHFHHVGNVSNYSHLCWLLNEVDCACCVT